MPGYMACDELLRRNDKLRNVYDTNIYKRGFFCHLGIVICSQ